LTAIRSTEWALDE